MSGLNPDLRTLCAAYGLVGAEFYLPPVSNAGDEIYFLEGAETCDRLRAIRVVPWGRFGNAVLQLLNGVMLARKLGLAEVQIVPFTFGPAAAETQIGDIRFIDPGRVPPASPVLVGYFFGARYFPVQLRDVTAGFANDTLDRYIKPLLRDIVGARHSLSPDVAVLHFRAGDIFSAKPHPSYVQPPVSYYLAAVDYLVKNRGVKSVRLVAEGSSNPAVKAVQQALRQRGIPFAYQSSRFAEDFGTLCGAAHLVASFSTFCEAAAMLGDGMSTYIAFRDIESHSHSHARPDSLLAAMLREKGVRCVLIKDMAGRYTKKGAWANNPAQRAMLLHYGGSNLAVVDENPA
jgi:hypothetical protein